MYAYKSWWGSEHVNRGLQLNTQTLCCNCVHNTVHRLYTSGKLKAGEREGMEGGSARPQHIIHQACTMDVEDDRLA